MDTEAESALLAAASRFETEAKIVYIRKYGNGNVNDTFLVTLDRPEKHFILQRINTRVFRRPELVMLNLRTLTEHIRSRLHHATLGGRRRWEMPSLCLTMDAQDHWIDADGSFWRAMSFIENADSFDTIQDMDHAGEVGYALGMFHSLLSDLPADILVDTLEGFHITPLYLRRYDQVIAQSSARRRSSPEVSHAVEFVNLQRARAGVLEDARALGKLCLRPIHGDPKVNNILMDKSTRRAVSIVDLDTVKPGLVHYDIGDCLRSCCNRLGEETEQWDSVAFDLDICRAVLRGYLPPAKDFLSEIDREYIFESIRLIAFELGLRFFTDYLEGNVYFKARHKEHNLFRAIVQFRLAESIESQEAAIRGIIRETR